MIIKTETSCCSLHILLLSIFESKAELDCFLNFLLRFFGNNMIFHIAIYNNIRYKIHQYICIVNANDHNCKQIVAEEQNAIIIGD